MGCPQFEAAILLAAGFTSSVAVVQHGLTCISDPVFPEYKKNVEWQTSSRARDTFSQCRDLVGGTEDARLSLIAVALGVY